MKTETCILLIALLMPLLPAAVYRAAADNYFVYFGTYTSGTSRGIYVSRFDAAMGTLSPPMLAVETANPSFVALHPNRKYLYAVSEVGEFGGQKSGAVAAFAVDPGSGMLSLINKMPSRGTGPCHVSVDRSGKVLMVANYGSGSIAVLPIRSDGGLNEPSAFVQHTGSSVNPQRQAGPHAHSINPSPDNRFVFAADLGLDKVMIYRLDPAKGTLETNDPPFGQVRPGAGPRHFAFHPGGKFAYVINEMQSTVTAFSYEESRGALKEIQTITTLPADFKAQNSTAEVQVHPSGRFLYGSNRGHDSIAVFAIDPARGSLTGIEQAPSGGRTPRNFGIDPTGRTLIAAHQNSNNVVVFRIDPETGRLKATGQSYELGSPVCVKFLPAP